MQNKYTDNSENDNYSNESDAENLKALIFKYLKYWPLFLISIIVFIIGAYFYLKFTTPIYKSSAAVKVLKDDEGGVDLSGLSKSTALFNYSKVNLENEIQIFKSRRLLEKVVEKLELKTSYYEITNFDNKLLFGDEIPFKIDWLDVDYSELNPIAFEVNFLNASSVVIKNEEHNLNINAKVNDTVNLNKISFVLKARPNVSNNYLIKKYKITHNSLQGLLSSLSNGISISQIGDKSDVLKLEVSGSNKSRNEHILNSLVDIFNQDGVEDKRLISKRTQEFVEDRLKILVKDLDTVETGLVNYKKNNNVVSVESSVEELFTKEGESESEKFNLETQLAISEDFQNLLKNQSGFELLPANLGINSSSVNNLTSKYNELVIERNRLLISSTEENPVILKINDQLSQVKVNILSSLNNYVEGLRISLSRLNEREINYTNQINSLPEKEKDLKSIIRQQAIKERLYLFLLQKREEAALSYATTSPSLKIVDYAYTNSIPVSPKKNIIFLSSLILGVLFPFGILYLFFLLKTSIESRGDLERHLNNLAIIGEVPQINKTQPKVIKKNDQSILAEAFRILRTNLVFNLKRGNDSKVIFVTSSIKGEGKTFTAVNLSRILATSHKKVILIGSDLRNPQVHQYFNSKKNDLGLSHFLHSGGDSIDAYINKNPDKDFLNLDIILSGSVPPNPAELLSNGRFELMLNQLKNDYDYIVVDTAPTIYVTDTFLIAEQADATVYMIKQDLTEKKLIGHINSLNRTGKLNNINLVFNGISSETNLGYGYGYTYNDKVKPFWKFW